MIEQDFARYARLGLKRNPFGTLTGPEQAQILILPEVVEQVLKTPQHIEFIGDRGRGKTALMHASFGWLESHGERIVYERLPPFQRVYHQTTSELDCYLLDEAQRLFVWHKWRLTRAARTTRLILGTHASYRRWLKWTGQDLHTFPVSELIDHPYIKSILNRRLTVFSSSDISPISISDDAAQWLMATFADDLRAINGLMYYAVEAMREPATISVDQIRQVALRTPVPPSHPGASPGRTWRVFSRRP